MEFNMYKTKIILLTLLINLALTILIHAQENSSKEQLHQKYSQALYSIGSEKYEQAIAILKEIIEQNPDMSKAYIKLAQVLNRSKNWNAAIEYYIKQL